MWAPRGRATPQQPVPGCSQGLWSFRVTWACVLPVRPRPLLHHTGQAFACRGATIGQSRVCAPRSVWLRAERRVECRSTACALAHTAARPSGHRFVPRRAVAVELAATRQLTAQSLVAVAVSISAVFGELWAYSSTRSYRLQINSIGPQTSPWAPSRKHRREQHREQHRELPLTSTPARPAKTSPYWNV